VPPQFRKSSNTGKIKAPALQPASPTQSARWPWGNGVQNAMVENIDAGAIFGPQKIDQAPDMVWNYFLLQIASFTCDYGIFR
jgi:hypothetical protein